jgi:membrane protein DedA with SNARE-associated domain
VVTILSGVANFNLGLFILSAIVARGGRFFALAWLLNTYGEEMRHFIEKRLSLISAIVAGALIVVYGAYVLLH